MRERTQVAIVGGGPAGLLLGHLLSRQGIESVIVESRTREHVIDRVRAGVLEQGTVDLLVQAGVGERLMREGLRHRGIYLCFNRRRHHIDFEELTGGRSITIYGQNEVVKDLIGARCSASLPLHFEARDVAIRELDGPLPKVRFQIAGATHEIECDFIAGCDGSHGVCRPSIPASAVQVYERSYPYGWLGILAEAAPSCDELVYAASPRGFALFSMRSRSLTRLYLQCACDERVDTWSNDRVWEELQGRLETDDGWRPCRGEIIQKGITTMRSSVVEPMRYGRLFLAGDAAHIVPPTGAKGLNLAVADVRNLFRAFRSYYKTGSEELLNGYSDRCLDRVWKAQRFSCWMTSTLHLSACDTSFEYKRQMAELEYLTRSRAAMTSLAENYTGLVLD